MFLKILRQLLYFDLVYSTILLEIKVSIKYSNLGFITKKFSLVRFNNYTKNIGV